jgi:DNA-binding PadR family transcriptional regulator
MRGSQHGWGGRRGPWGPPFAWGPRGPRMRRGDVRGAILALLTERPMHGYEMMQELEGRSGGAWRPSAGSIYPTLQQLEDEGLVKSEEVGDRRRYTLTDAGREEAGRREGPPPWEAQDATGAGGELREAAFRVAAAVMQAASTGTDEQVAQVREILVDARQRIYSVLGEEPKR